MTPSEIQSPDAYTRVGMQTEVFAVCIFPQTHSLQDLQQPAVSSKVFIQRDYSSGTVCRFQTKFPSELESKIDKQQFEETIQSLNNLYAEAEKLGGKSYLEGCLACLTAYTIFLCMETHYEKVLKKIARYIKDQNEKIYAPRGLLLTDPIERGLRVVEFTIFEERSVGSGR
ncbi:golgin subfamily A member 7-like [Xenentodon cancila]